MNTIGRQDLHIALAHHTQDVLEGNWRVAEAAAAGATTFTVSLANPAAVTPNVGASDAGNFVGARIVFWGGDLAGGGSLNRGFSTEVALVSSTIADETITTTVTIKDALPAALTPGDTFTIYRTVTASENIAEVGGAGVPTVNGVPALPTMTPIERVAFLSNVAVDAGTNVLAANLTPSVEGIYRVRSLVSVGSTFSIVEINSAAAATGASAPVVGATQAGAALVAGAWYEVDFSAGPHETYNFQVGTACNLSLRVQFIAK